MIIRDAVEEDLPAIVEIYNSTIPGRMVTADIEPVSVESRVQWFREHDRAQRPLWVADDNGVMGWLSIQSFYGRPAYHATVEISVYVAEAARRRGIARRLLTGALRLAPEWNVQNILGFVFGHNQPSLQLFEQLGFERWALLPGVAELDGQERDLVIVGRRV